MITAVSKITYRNTTTDPDTPLTQSTSIDDYILDVLVTVKNDKKKSSTPVNRRSTIPSQIAGKVTSDEISVRSDVSSISERRSSVSAKTKKTIITKDSEVELWIHLIGPTMSRTIKG